MLIVKKSGPRTLVQDMGRYNVADLGISQGGPLDIYAFCSAHYLLKNEVSCSALEIAVGNAHFEFQQATAFALTGAEMGATLNGVSIAPWAVHMVRTGDRLELGYCQNGNIAYLTVRGGFQMQCILGSAATVTRNRLGGVNGDGRPVQNDDMLPYAASSDGEVRKLSSRHIPDYNKTERIHVLPGYQVDQFNQSALALFFSSKYKLLPNSDRMGYRFSGSAVSSEIAGIISEGIALGAVQIPPDGQPIVLMQDRQTIGGYPKIGCVRRTDIGKLAQVRFGKSIQFVQDTFPEAKEKWLAFARFFLR